MWPHIDIGSLSKWSDIGLHLACGLLMACIFYVDMRLPLGVAIGSLYIIAVLMAIGSHRRRPIVLVALVSSLLVIVAVLLKPSVEMMEKALLNRGIALATIWVTALLGLKIKGTEQELVRIASLDFLTGLLNRREIFNRLYTEVCRVDRIDRPFSLIMVDIDHFKAINDQFGHTTGDKVLKHLAWILKKNLRDYDFVCRYGGEEFLVVTPETPLEVAHELAERLRRTVAETRFTIAAVPLIRITISAGVARFTKGERIESLLDRVDRALYRAKEAGRNRVEIDATE